MDQDKVSMTSAKAVMQNWPKFDDISKSDKADNTEANLKEKVLSNFFDGDLTGIEDEIGEAPEDLEVLINCLRHICKTQTAPISILAPAEAVLDKEVDRVVKNLMESLL